MRLATPPLVFHLAAIFLVVFSLGSFPGPFASPLHARVAVDLEGLDFSRAESIALPEPATPKSALALAVLDFDHDGVDDLAVLRRGGEEAEIVVRFGNPLAVYPHYPQPARQRPGVMGSESLFAGAFANASGPFIAPPEAAGLVVMDLDLDARRDLVLVDDADQPIAWLKSGRAHSEMPVVGDEEAQRLEVSPWSAYPDLLAERQERIFRASLGHSPRDQASIRLGAHAGGDLVMLSDDGDLRFIPRARGGGFIVNSAMNAGDSYDEDGICDTANNPTTDPPTPPSGLCTLRAAIEQANFNAGADTISFAIGGGGPVTIDVNGVMEITEALTVDATTQAGFAGTPLITLNFDGGGILPGLSVMAGPSLIRGFSSVGFSAEGLSVFANDVTIETCFLGVEADGVTPNGSFRGFGSSGERTTFGGLFPNAGNLVSGNSFGGTGFSGDEAKILGNLIGTDITGTLGIGNGSPIGNGILVTGHDAEITENLVSGHGSAGIQVEGDESLVNRNKVGTNLAGDAGISNFFAGIYLKGAQGGVVGGVLNPISSNLVSGNFGDGIRLAGSTLVSVVGNLVGTDLSGTAPLGNDFNGIHLEDDGPVATSGIMVGGPNTFLGALGNLVAANGAQGWHGVFIEDGSFATKVTGNLIGLNFGGTIPLGNTVDGVRIQEAEDNFVGGINGSMTEIPNLIAFNGGAGIAVVDVDSTSGAQNSSSNAILINRLYENGGLGIDLTRGSTTLDGPNSNDVGDDDFGPNRLQNFPLITMVTEPSAGVTQIQGTLDSEPNLPFDIRIFTNDACDPSGFGEARIFVGTVRVNTDSGGSASFSLQTMTQVNILTATATNVDSFQSSELSPCTTGLAGGRLGNRVWHDADDDGLQGAEEEGLEGVLVRLLNNTGAVVLDTTLTDAAGFYAFDDVATGTYRIGVVAPTGFQETLANEGVDDTIDSDIEAGLITDPFGYTFGSVDLTRDAGLTSLIFKDDFENGLGAWTIVVGGV